MIIVPLGVASATPTATRHLPSVALWREGSVFLFDCGENTQMRMLQASLKRSKVDYIFLSHFDTDHYSGLMGLLSTLQLQRREKPLVLAGPKGLREYVEWNFKFANLQLSYELVFKELEEDFEVERVVDEEEYYVEARPLKHNIFCIGYRFQEKDRPGKVDAEKALERGITEDWQYKDLKAGKDVSLQDGTVVEASDIVGHPRPGDSVAYITDTRYCPNAVKLGMNTNILLHEATFGESLSDKAEETGHSTARDAARVANEAQTKLLVITHFSARYTNPFVLLREAREHFFPTWIATE
ncbi:MAG: ribonuclease Z, partial [Balneolaceae bacterium]